MGDNLQPHSWDSQINIPLLLKASFAKDLLKHLESYQENKKLIVKAIREDSFLVRGFC